MTTADAPGKLIRVPESTVRLARALVHNASRRGTREDPRIEAVARTPLPDDKKA